MRRCAARRRRSTCSSTTPGIGGGEPVEGSDIARWRRTIDTNLTGMYLVTREAVALAARRRPHRQHLVGARPVRRAGLHGLLRVEARRHRLHARAGARAGATPRSPSTRCVPAGWTPRWPRRACSRAPRRPARRSRSSASGRSARSRSSGSSSRRKSPSWSASGLARRVRHHRADLQHLRRPDDGLSASAQPL